MANGLYSRPSLPATVVRKLKSFLELSKPTLTADSIIVFVCGADPSNPTKRGRTTLMDYVKKNLKHFRFFRAEEVFSILGDENVIDLLTIEEYLADFSDCIILIIESKLIFDLPCFLLQCDTENSSILAPRLWLFNMISESMNQSFDFKSNFS